MKTARFASVVEKAGRPEVYLPLMDPEKDRTLQAAVKTHRVMTVVQESFGHKTDRGEIGFEPGSHRQFLIFPKSLKTFAGSTIVGIKYDLLQEQELPKRERRKPASTPRKKKPERHQKTQKHPQKIPASPNVVPFKHEAVKEEDEDVEISDLKKQVRHAMKVLEEGKAVAAFNLLKRIVDE